MENTLENKAKFFAQYFGQEVRVWKEMPESLCNVGYAALQPEAIPVSHLELTPLSQISDEDTLWFAKKLWIPDYFKNKKESEIIEKTRFELVGNSWLKVSEVIDYFRLKGYAVDWNGLSVEDQIKYGWVKLK